MELEKRHPLQCPKFNNEHRLLPWQVRVGEVACSRFQAKHSTEFLPPSTSLLLPLLVRSLLISFNVERRLGQC